MCACTSVLYMYVGRSSSKAFDTHLMHAFDNSQHYAGTGLTVRNIHSTVLKDPEDTGQQKDNYNMLCKAVREVGRGWRKHQGAVKVSGKAFWKGSCLEFPKSSRGTVLGGRKYDTGKQLDVREELVVPRVTGPESTIRSEEK